MRDFPISPVEISKSIIKNFGLIKTTVKREIQSRYRGSFIGVIWTILLPIMMLGVYTFVFGEVFQARWNVENDSKVEFALVLYTGLMAFNLFAETVTRAPFLILGNPNYVKKIVYPLEILPLVNLGAAIFNFIVSLLVWIIAYCVFMGLPHITIVMLPVVVLPFIIYLAGINWLLASIGVFIRDISQFLNVLVTAMLFLSPIFYSPEFFPERYRNILMYNPITPVIEMMRDVMYWGVYPDMHTLVYYYVLALIVFFAGFAWFQKTRKGFADVI